MVAKKTNSVIFKHFKKRLGKVPVEETYIHENCLKFARNCQVLVQKIKKGKKLRFPKKKQNKIKKEDKKEKGKKGTKLKTKMGTLSLEKKSDESAKEKRWRIGQRRGPRRDDCVVGCGSGGGPGKNRHRWRWSKNED